MSRALSIITAALAVLLTSCGKNTDDNAANPYKPLDLSTKSAELVSEGHRFSFDYIDRINAVADKDYIVSPLSMQFLLGMILNGAQGKTAQEICGVLGYGEGEVPAVNEYCLSMLEQLPSLDRKTRLSIANAIFVDDGWPLKKGYVADAGRYYKAEVRNLDFADGKKSLDVINSWCSKNTAGMIPKVLDEVSPDYLAYLLNALYFKSQWKEKFSKSATADEDFTSESGVKSKVKMMKQSKKYGYLSTKLFQMVRIPYGNGAFAMTVFLPKDGYRVSDVCAFLKDADWNAYRYGSTCEVDLWIPRFETKFHIKLNDILSEMGMPTSFMGGKADFKAMSDYADYLGFVQQDAAIKVDEDGAEAAVVSSAGMVKESALGPNENAVFHADHPFLYLITESSTGAVLFAGRFSGN